MPDVSCDHTRELLHGYLDGELDLVRSIDIERHLEGCAECATRYRGQQALRATVRDAALRYVAPPQLVRRVQLTLRGPGDATRGTATTSLARRRQWRPL